MEKLSGLIKKNIYKLDCLMDALNTHSLVYFNYASVNRQKHCLNYHWTSKLLGFLNV